MKKYSLMCLPVICAVMAPLSADVARTNQHSWRSKGTSTQPTSSTDEITPPALPRIKRCADPFLTAEYIYWKAEQEGLEYAASGIAIGPLSSVSKKGKIHNPDFDASSGFKVGFGLRFRHDAWDLYSNYTWLRPGGSKRSTKQHPGQDLQATWIDPALLDPSGVIDDIQKASATWNLDFNALDLELGRNYFISRRLTLRPFIGLKFGWLEQRNDVEYTNAAGGLNEYKYKLRQEQFGVGIRTGLNTAWYMWNKWSIYGNFAASALYNDFDAHQKMNYQIPTGKHTHINIKNDHQHVSPVLEFGLGLRFETDFYENRYQFLVQMGWEEQIWFNQNQFSNFQNDRAGNLTIQGLTLKAGFSF